ncbi:ANTAR domain-containing protein [Rhodococcus sp. NBC_00297]|uniref:ANTAR domain-containing protein n=1 Tax=Rhodococcus sp. NBC_00297 TaxID=2976005 RepID=UPI002E28F021|nr:ANTAR domain-containing protein [Rhodococcus sp. NBC_00297]
MSQHQPADSPDDTKQAARLRSALDHRRIEAMAVGIVMVIDDVGILEATARIAADAQRQGMDIHALAATICHTRIYP